MRNLPFTIRQLEVFSTLCTNRSFRRTAEQLGISQPSVSNQIRTLEEQLGTRLFLRISGKRPSLTTEGLAFLDDLAAFDDAVRTLAAHRKSAEPSEARSRYRIRAGQGLIDHYIRPKLDSFLVSNPDIRLEFDTQPPSERTGTDVEKGDFDFALLHLREDHAVSPVFRNIALVAGGIYGHRKFAEGHKLPLTSDYLSTLPFILPREGSPQEQQVHLALRRAGITPRKIVSHTQYFDVIASMLGQGLGVASFAEVILPPPLRRTVVLLCPLNSWRLIFYRRDRGKDPKLDRVELFLLSSVLRDPNYPTLSIFPTSYPSQRA